MEELKKETELDEIIEQNPEVKFLLELLTMDDEHLKALAPFFLQEIERNLNLPSVRLDFIHTLQSMHAEVDETIAELENLENIVKSEEKLSDYKKDFFTSYITIVKNALNEEFGEGKDLVEIPISFCHEDAKMPTYARLGDAGLDVFALEDIDIAPGETKLIKLGIKVAIPMGYELQVRPKSGRSLKSKLRIANTPGTIDSGYRDEVGVIIENIESPIRELKYHFDDENKIVIDSIEHGRVHTIGKGEKFAQLVLNKVSTAAFKEVNNVSEIGENRGGGFGSTGLK